MIGRRSPLFLARQSYRRRRLIDAARLVPLFGGAVMLVPLLWGEPDSGSLAVRGLFIFTAWGGLVLVSAVLARKLTEISETPDPTQPAQPSKSGQIEGDGDVL